MIWINLRKSKSDENSVIMRILTNYLQVILVVSTLQLEWPQLLKNFFSLFAAPGDSMQILLSFDCLISFYFASRTSTFYLKTFAIGMLPLVYALIFLLIFLTLRLVYKQHKELFMRRVITTIIVIMYVMHPTLTRYALAIFFCLETEPGIRLLQDDVQVKCWVGEHMRLSFLIGLPLFFVMVLGIPVAALVFLIRRRKQLGEAAFQSRWQKLYNGLKNEVFYWEFVNVGRKVTLVGINIFLQTEKEIFKAMVGLLFLCILYRIEFKILPYRSPLLNYLEQREYFTSLTTFFGSLFFVNTEFSEPVQLFVIVFILLCNCWFMSLWLYLALNQWKWRVAQKLALLFQYLSLIRWTLGSNEEGLVSMMTMQSNASEKQEKREMEIVRE